MDELDSRLRGNDAQRGWPTVPGLFTLLREDVACVFQRDPAARSRFEVLTTYPGVHAILLQRLAHRLWQRRPALSGAAAGLVRAPADQYRHPSRRDASAAASSSTTAPAW